MSALEQELFDRIRKMDEARQKQLLQFIENTEPKPFDSDEWMRGVNAFRAKLAAKYGEDYVVGALDLSDELREEASWPRL